MTSIKFHFRASTREGVHEGKLFIRLIHKRKIINIPTDYKIFPREWNQQDNELIFPKDDFDRLKYVFHVMEKMKNDLQLLELCVSQLSEKGEYDVADVANLFRARFEKKSLLDYGHQVSHQLARAGQERTARAYLSAIKSLYKFTSGMPVMLEELDVALMNAYEAYLTERGLSLNTISFYMRNLRAVYNRAVKEGVVKPKEFNPFEKVYTGISESERRALSVHELNSMACLDNEITTRLETTCGQASEQNVREVRHYRNLKKALYYFLFCYHARGMSFVDLAYLRKSDIQGETIVYRRKKTGGCLKVKITKPMRTILRYFETETADSKFVFPVINPRKGDERKQYEIGLHHQNIFLGYLGRHAGLEKKVTTHVSRHTWATLAKHANIPTAVISEALGHRDLKTTDRYLASFEASIMDRLSEKMSGIIKKGKQLQKTN